MFSSTLVHNYLSRSAGLFPDKAALICEGDRLTYKSLDSFSDRLAYTFMDMGVKRQDRIVIFLDNSSESVISLYGILKAGCVYITVNGSMKARQLNYILRDSGARIMITHSDKARVVEDAVGNLDTECKVLWIGESRGIPGKLSSISYEWNSVFSDMNQSEKKPDSLKLNETGQNCIDLDLAALIYTSGSTADPKGVMSSHRNVISAAQSIIQYLENRNDDIIINVLPLSFDYGLYQVIMSVMFGGTVVLEKNFLFLHKILKTIEEERVTGFPIVPTIAAMLLGMKNLKKYDFSSLRYMTNTGAALPVEHIRRIRTLFPHVKFFSMFGLTECKRVSYLPPEELDRRPSSVGKAMPNCEVFILDEDGNEAAPGEVGELVIRGSNVMRGYWNAPELTAKTYRPGRFPDEKVLYSGDYFRKDEEGFLYFLGRKDDMIKSKGERVSPKEVENIICEIEGVAEAAVIGVPDEILGKAIKAFVAPVKGSKLTDKTVLKYCANNLETFKVPKYVILIDSLPRTPNGKIDKKALEKEFN